MAAKSGGLVVLGAALLSVAAAAPADAARCQRLGMSDVAFSKEAAYQSAAAKLDEHAQKVAREKGWPNPTKLTRSNEKRAWCRVYADFGLFGTEWRCAVNVTYCAR